MLRFDQGFIAKLAIARGRILRFYIVHVGIEARHDAAPISRKCMKTQSVLTILSSTSFDLSFRRVPILHRNRRNETGKQWFRCFSDVAQNAPGSTSLECMSPGPQTGPDLYPKSTQVGRQAGPSLDRIGIRQR